jgi:hypothetical protein
MIKTYHIDDNKITKNYETHLQYQIYQTYDEEDKKNFSTHLWHLIY